MRTLLVAIVVSICLAYVVENPDVARVFLEGLADRPEISAVDSTRFAFLLGQYVGTEASYFDEVRFGVGSPERLKDRQVGLIRFLSTPGGRRWWSLVRQSMPREFRDYVQEKLDAETSL